MRVYSACGMGPLVSILVRLFTITVIAQSASSSYGLVRWCLATVVRRYYLYCRQADIDGDNQLDLTELTDAIARQTRQHIIVSSSH